MERDLFLDASYLRGRKIIIWGIDSPQTKEVVKLLTEKGLEIDFFVDSSIKECREKEKPITEIRGLASSHYVIVAMRVRHPEVDEFLYENGYIEIDDYFWFGQSSRILRMQNGTYHDRLDNEISMDNCEGEAEIMVTGRGNRVNIHSSVILGKLKIIASNRAALNLDEAIICNNNVITVRAATVEVSGGSKLMGCNITAAASKAEVRASVLCKNSILEMSNSAKLAMYNTCFHGNCRISRFVETIINECDIDEAVIDVSRGGSTNIEKTVLKAKVMVFVMGISQATLRNVKCGEGAHINIRSHSKSEILDTQFGNSANFQCIDSKSEILNSQFGNSANLQCVDSSSMYIYNLKGEEKFRTAIQERSKVTLEGGNYRENSQIICHHSSEITIGPNYSANKNLYVIANHGSSVIVKEDGISAENVSIISGDSHPVFDIDNPKEYAADSKIEIDAHVWLGKGCVILSNTKIGEGSIVSPDSVLGREYPNNCMIMGYPARVVKKNITYSSTIENPHDLIESKYWRHTQE